VFTDSRFWLMSGDQDRDHDAFDNYDKDHGGAYELNRSKDHMGANPLRGHDR
jgi:hypothetical protein